MNPYINNVSWGISLVLRQTASKQVTLKPQFPPKKIMKSPSLLLLMGIHCKLMTKTGGKKHVEINFLLFFFSYSIHVVNKVY